MDANSSNGVVGSAHWVTTISSTMDSLVVGKNATLEFSPRLSWLNNSLPDPSNDAEVDVYLSQLLGQLFVAEFVRLPFRGSAYRRARRAGR